MARQRRQAPPAKSFWKYDIEWDAGISDLQIELWCYRNNHTPEMGGLGKAEHMKRAIKARYPDEFYRWHYWVDRRIESFCKHDYQTWWGPSSVAKSTDAGMIIHTHWLADPINTTVIVCSTTKDSLEKRIWKEIVKFHEYDAESIYGVYKKSDHAIMLPQEQGGTTISGIFGVAILKGTLKEALGNLHGIHNRFNCLVIDEMQATRLAAVDAFDNLSTGEEAKFLGMGNPESRLDPLGRESEPSAGWDSIDITHEEWKTRGGVTLFFDGLKSPAVIEPDGEKKYPFLLNKKQIDRLKQKRGEDSPQFWSQRRGFLPPEGLRQTVISESFIQKFHMMDPAMWQYGFDICAGLDPAFSNGGARAILAPAIYGMMEHGVIGVAFLDPLEINLKIKKGEPLEYSLAHDVIAHCKSLGVEPHALGVDITGQQSALAAIIEKEWRAGLYRVNFGGAPSDLLVSKEDPRPAKQVYKNRITELYFNVREFGQGGQIRGLSVDAAKEFSERETLEKLNPICVEPKPVMISRTGLSPDVADACCVVIAMLRERFGLHPTGLEIPEDDHSDDDEFFREMDIDARPNKYMHNGVKIIPLVIQPQRCISIAA